jgi:hypothetical protein
MGDKSAIEWTDVRHRVDNANLWQETRRAHSRQQLLVLASPSTSTQRTSLQVRSGVAAVARGTRSTPSIVITLVATAARPPVGCSTSASTKRPTPRCPQISGSRVAQRQRRRATGMYARRAGASTCSCAPVASRARTPSLASTAGMNGSPVSGGMSTTTISATPLSITSMSRRCARRVPTSASTRAPSRSGPRPFKQWGGATPKSGGRLLDGREWNEFPRAAVS